MRCVLTGLAGRQSWKTLCRDYGSRYIIFRPMAGATSSALALPRTNIRKHGRVTVTEKNLVVFLASGLSIYLCCFFESTFLLSSLLYDHCLLLLRDFCLLSTVLGLVSSFYVTLL